MSLKWTNKTLLAAGGMTAAIALLTALPSARADELSNLRANQQLLQQRLDQLAAAEHMSGEHLGVAKGSFPRSFLIPGTDTSIRVGGFARLDMEYFMSGGPSAPNGSNNFGEFHVQGIHVGPGFSASPHSFAMTATESRVRIETRTPTSWGPADTVIEFDFGGGSYGLHPGDSMKPRLRLAYGTLGPWLAGQDYSMFRDGASHIDTIDFGGDVATGGVVRVPQLRYTYHAGNGWSIAGDIEAPDAGLVSPFTGPTDSVKVGYPPLSNPMPDFVGAIVWHQPWGHLNLRGIIRDMKFTPEGGSSRDEVGGGAALSGSFLPGIGNGGRDFFGFGVTGGSGLGRYNADDYAFDSNYDPTSPTYDPSDVRTHTVDSIGGHVGYKHWWARHWASDISFGIAHFYHKTSLIGSAAGDTNKELMTAHANIYYYPVSFVTVGLEYMWGHRKVMTNETGSENILLGEVTVKY